MLGFSKEILKRQFIGYIIIIQIFQKTQMQDLVLDS